MLGLQYERRAMSSRGADDGECGDELRRNIARCMKERYTPREEAGGTDGSPFQNDGLDSDERIRFQKLFSDAVKQVNALEQDRDAARAEVERLKRLLKEEYEETNRSIAAGKIHSEEKDAEIASLREMLACALSFELDNGVVIRRSARGGYRLLNGASHDTYSSHASLEAAFEAAKRI